MRLPFTVIVKVGTGSAGALRPGTDSKAARSTTLPSASKASNTAGVPVDPQNEIVTDETGLGNVARTGIGSVAIAQTMPLWPVERWVKNINDALSLRLLRLAREGESDALLFPSRHSVRLAIGQ